MPKSSRSEVPLWGYLSVGRLWSALETGRGPAPPGHGQLAIPIECPVSRERRGHPHRPVARGESAKGAGRCRKPIRHKMRRPIGTALRTLVWDILLRCRSKNRMKADEELKPGRVIWLRYIRPSKVPIEYKELENKDSVIISSPEVSEPSIVETPIAVEEDVEPVDRPLTFLEKLDSLERLEQNTTPMATVKEVNAPPVNDAKADPVVELNKTDSTLHIHNVKAGETFYAISKLYKVNVLDLLDWNELTINDKLSIDQKIKVYTIDRLSQQSESEKATKEPDYEEYVVSSGDTLYSIARSKGVKVEDLLDWNNKTEASIRLGEVLKIKKR